MRVAKVVMLTRPGQGANRVVEVVAWAKHAHKARATRQHRLGRGRSGKRNDEIAADLGCTRRTVGTWRNRFVNHRLEGIQKDAPRGGRRPARRTAVAAEIVGRTQPQEQPANATHWSTRSLAKAMNISDSMVRRVWQDSGLKPHLVKTFKLSNDPRLPLEKLVDVVGLYLNPPEHALVILRRKKSDSGSRPYAKESADVPGRLGTLTHDYTAKRNNDLVCGH